MSYVKSPLNYTGGKFKLLPNIIPHVPSGTKVFLDLFSGGGTVGANMVGISDIVILNEILTPVTDFYSGVKNTGVEKGLECIYNTINSYGLSKTNKDGFLAIRDAYNNGDKDWVTFYTMLMHSFNYQIRFNSKGEYNMPFGKDRSSFNKNTEKNFREFGEKLVDDSLHVMNKNFKDIDYSLFTSGFFVYADPPYLITTASYNENGGWNEKDEHDLLQLLDTLDAQGCKWMLSNVLEHKGKTNEILSSWAENYHVTDLNYDYKNSSYQGKNTDKLTREVIITNYPLDIMEELNGNILNAE